jgi:hypothetical protein
MEQINGHMYFQNIFGLIAPVDPQPLSRQQIALHMLSESGESKEDALSLILGG